MRVNAVELHVHDSGPRNGVPVVFSHGLLFDHRMFDEQTEALNHRYRVVRYDHRGQGLSQRMTGKGIGIETLYEDAVGLIEGLDLGPCHFVGLSMGGFVGLRLGARRPDLLRSLVLMETSSDPEENVAAYRRLEFVVRFAGPRPVIGRVMPILFGRSFMADPARNAERARWRSHLAGLDRGVWRASRGVIERSGCHEELERISTPTLVIVGDEDVATPPEKARRIHDAIEGSKLVTIPDAGHTSTVEQPARVNEALLAFLAEVDGTG